MTLYMLFEAIEAKRIGLDDAMPVTAFAAARAPSKLGLRPARRSACATPCSASR